MTTKTAHFGEIGNWKDYYDRIVKPNSNGESSLVLYEWADRPVQLSEGFYAGDFPESRKFDDGPSVIKGIMDQIDSAFSNKDRKLQDEYRKDKGFRAYLLDRFKDPGILYHCVFWELGKSSEAISFEWLHFRDESKLRLKMLSGEIFGPQAADAGQSSWKCLMDLYREQIERHREDDPDQAECHHGDSPGQIEYRTKDDSSWKLFTTVLGWPKLLP